MILVEMPKTTTGTSPQPKTTTDKNKIIENGTTIQASKKTAILKNKVDFSRKPFS